MPIDSFRRPVSAAMEMSLQRQADKIDVHRVNNTHKQGLQPFANQPRCKDAFFPSFFSTPLLDSSSFSPLSPSPSPFISRLKRASDRNRRRAFESTRLLAKGHESTVLHFNSSVDVLDGSLPAIHLYTDGLEMQILLLSSWRGGGGACPGRGEGGGELTVLKEV